MPGYKSKKSQSYKKSKNSKNSKSGGRRRKHTMKKYRRGRKVMRGGRMVTYEELEQKLDDMGAKKAFLQAMARTDNDFDAFKTETMMKTQNADTVDLNSILNVISDKTIYTNAVNAIKQLNESS